MLLGGYEGQPYISVIYYCVKYCYFKLQSISSVNNLQGDLLYIITHITFLLQLMNLILYSQAVEILFFHYVQLAIRRSASL